MTHPTLRTTLADIIDGRMPIPSPDGLMYQFKEPDEDKVFYRLFCYRKGDLPPTTTEFMTVRREMERLLPGRELKLAETVHRYRASDGVMRTGKVFSWWPETAQQPALLDVPTLAVPVRYE